MAQDILVIEDDKHIAHLVKTNLEDAGFQAELAFDGHNGLELALSGQYRLIILDLKLPGIDGLDICRQVRAGSLYMPILVLTSMSSEIDRVLGLEIGADDYLTKPFSLRELVARVKALLRRMEAHKSAASTENPRIISVGELTIDTEKREVSIKNAAVNLTAKEFDLLLQFAQHPGRVYTRSELLDQVWGYVYKGYEHTVNSHINRLRAKIEEDPAQPQYICTVWGVGYKFCSPRN